MRDPVMRVADDQGRVEERRRSPFWRAPHLHQPRLLSARRAAITLCPMHMLEPPDTHHLAAAVGWLELGNETEARIELAKISAPSQRIPVVLEVAWMLDASEENWDAALQTARRLIEIDPAHSAGWLHQAYALRRVASGGLDAAWDALLPAATRFPTEPTIPYNLSCYACQLGRLDDARTWLRKALEVGDRTKIKTMALSDSDLKPLWNEISTW